MKQTNEKRMVENYEILHAIHVGDKEVIFGVNRECVEKNHKFMCSFCIKNEIGDSYDKAMVSDNYLEIMKMFAERVQSQVELVQKEQSDLNVPIETITAEQCFSNNYRESIEGKVVAIRADVLRCEYQTSDHQLVLVTGGFGAQANSRGSACFTTNLFNGKHSRFERNDIQGEVRPEHLPKWAKEKLAELQQPVEDTHQSMSM